MWLWNNYPATRGLCFSVPNGGLRDVREARRLKLEGLLPGVSDLIFLWDGRAYLIEMKTPKGLQRQVQKDWQRKVEENGFNYYLCRCLNDFKAIILSIIQ